MCKHPFWRQRWSQPRARTYPWRGNGRKAGWCCHPQQGWERRNILTPHWFGRQDSRRIKLLKSRSRAGFLMEHSLLWVLFVCKEMQNVHNMCTYMYERTELVPTTTRPETLDLSGIEGRVTLTRYNFTRVWQECGSLNYVVYSSLSLSLFSFLLSSLFYISLHSMFFFLFSIFSMFIFFWIACDRSRHRTLPLSE